jgi:hypothetical protein
MLLHIGQHPAKIVAAITPRIMSQVDPREIREHLGLAHSGVAVVEHL